ncbi:MAG: hypothetical protein OIF50_09105 [Flavobacteriaceae bacterium]|nr:hypothetical protein [Flavobacteriaceae bacterium]
MQYSLFHLPDVQSEIDSALRSSMSEINQSKSTSKAQVESALKWNLRRTMQSYVQRMQTGGGMAQAGPGDPPGTGFRVTFGLQLLVSYKLRFKANVNLGYGKRFGAVAGNTSMHFSVYNSGLGTPVGSSKPSIDISVAANLIVGGGEGMPLQSYALNYDTPIPMLNNFDYSLRYGQLYTWNAALHNNQFSLDRLQREGLIGFRLGNVNVSSNNDTKRAYFGGGTDKGWTGGISIVTPMFEVGFQDFSGDYLRELRGGGIIPEVEIRDLKKEMKELLKKNSFNNQKVKEIKREYDEKIRKITNSKYHTQTPSQKRLNKASTYLRFNLQNGNFTQVDIEGAAWLQNFIHRRINDLRFEYDYHNIQFYGGKRF